MPDRDIIVIGASAGGIEALINIMRTLPAHLAAAIFVTVHLPPQRPSALANVLDRAGPLPAVAAQDGATIEPGCIYVAPPDHHVLIEPGVMHVVRGPRENGFRPAIDPMFRTAARSYGPRVLGVVLSGMLDDGTAGLLAIKRRGGVVIVQDPQESLFPSMPLSALAYVEVDYSLPVAEIGPLLADLTQQPAPSEGVMPVSDELNLESDISGRDYEAVQQAHTLGVPAPFSCPDCGGVLSEFYDGVLLRFRCQVGHSYSPQSILEGQAIALDHSLWNAYKSLDERVTMMQRLAVDAQRRGDLVAARRFQEQGRLVEAQKMQLYRILHAETDPPGSAADEVE